MNVADWLKGLDLAQYAQAFADNDVDLDLARTLTDADLKEIGVASLGHRRKLLAAAAALGAAAPAPTAPPPPSAHDGERRPITVMFCDLVGSTSLAAKLDAEDWRNLVGAYLDEASRAVTSLGGHVLKKLGDGLMALFGYPQAQENDGERAVRAALAIQRALAGLNARNAVTGAPELAARIGLESGRVVVDSSGEVFGEAPNVAARVQSAAAPGEIWITRGMHRQIAGLFVADDKGEHELKGVPDKVQLYRIVRASGGGRRGGSRAPTPLVGRGEELDILTRRWERARRGEGQLMLISGEPGLGKSRLIEEFRARLAETPHTWVEWASSQLLQNTPLHPVAEWGRARFGGAEVSGEKRLAELEAALASVGLDDAEYSVLLAPVIDAPTPPSRALKLSPEELRSRQLAALTAWVLAGARTQPLVLAFEDLHWADPTSLDVLQALAERGAQAPLLIIATTRPEFRPPWKLRSHHGVISLAPLDAGEIVRMVGEIATRHALSKDVIAGVSERSGGVPLFVEEVTRLLLERGEHGGVQAIPPTLQQSLAARLDRLGSAREIAQIGAVLGRGFSHALLQAVAGLEEPALRAALDKLADAELLFVEGVAPHANYRFKHALIQDAAYDSLLKTRRQALHRRAAEALLASPAPEAEALAHHFTQAGQTDLAIEWWGKAGDQALRRSAFAEAISHLGKAIELSDKAGGAARGKEGAGDKLKLRVSYGNALLSGRGYGAPETRAAFERARETAATPESALERFSIDYGLWSGAHLRGELPSMREMSQAFLRTCESRPESPESGIAHRLCGTTHWYAGEFAQARTHLDRALAILDPDRDRDLAWRFGQDVVLSAKAFLAFTLWAIGEILEARAHSDDLLALASRSRHVPTVIFGFAANPIFEMVAGTRAPVWPNIEALVRLARDNGLQLWIAFGGFLESWALWRSGDREGRLVEMRRGIESWREHVGTLYIPVICARLAEAEAESGEIEAALATINAVIAETAQSGQCWFDAEVHRIRGEILVKQNPADSAPAEAAFLAAVAVAQQQKARSFELRAALSLAKLYESTGRPIDAHNVLAPALAGFSSTPEFPTIAEAKALFEALTADETVKTDAARRAYRLKLQTDYGQAVMWSKGFAAEETKTAFARAGELATGIGNADAQFDAYYARWGRTFFLGELGSARETAESFLREAERSARPTEAAAAHRLLALTRLLQGDFARARGHCEQARQIYDPERDREAKFRLGMDSRGAATAYLALAGWQLGEVSGAGALMDEAIAHAVESAHVPTLVGIYLLQACLEAFRDDAEAAHRAAEAATALGREHGLSTFLGIGAPFLAWARAKLGDRDSGLTELRQALAGYAGQGNKAYLPLYQGLLAEIETEARGAKDTLTGIDEALALAGETGEHWFDAGLHRIRGEILIKQNPADPAPAEAAFLAAIAVAQQQKARSFELRAALSLAKLYQSAGRPIDAHGVLGPALAGFSPTPEFPTIAKAKALYEALAADETVKAGAAHRTQRLKLQTNYSQAVLWAKGYAAEETKAAYARAGELAMEIGNAEAPFDAYYGRWGHSLFRGELGSARETAESFLREAERAGRPTEAASAHRLLAAVLLFQGDFGEARAHCEQALRIYDPERDREAKFRVGTDARVAAICYLALAAWCVGDVGRARKLIDEARARAVESAHAPTLATTYYCQAWLEVIRDDADAALRAAEACVALSREHGLAVYLRSGVLTSDWARAKLGDRDSASTGLRQAVEAYARQGNKAWLPFYRGLLAEIEAERGDAEAALAEIDAALALAGEIGERWFYAGLHNIRGEILLRQNPADPAAAEAAFLAAIAVARSQRARSFELRAALSLAKLYHSTGRPIDAHDVLGPALEGFAPTPEFPAIAEAKALYDVLAADEGVKAEAARRAQRLKLQTNYGQAVMWSKGYAAEETKAAIARAEELATKIRNAEAPLDTYFGRWVQSLWRGEFGSAREAAESFLSEAEREMRLTEAGVAHRMLGVTLLNEGDFEQAGAHFEQTLRIYDADRDREARFRYSLDSAVVATACLAIVSWCLGDFARARALMDEAVARAVESAHAPTLANAYYNKGALEILRGDAEAARRAAEVMVALGREHGLALYLTWGALPSAWARAKLGDRDAGSVGFREALAGYASQGNKLRLPFYRGLLAEIEAEGGDVEAARAGIDGALALAGETGDHWFDAGLHRIRGEILLKQNPADPAPAEAAFLAAIAVAQQQKARSFELRAALSLAELYQSTGRPIDAHDLLAPALQGFSPTPEFPQVAEAKALFDGLAETDKVKAAVASRKQRARLQVALGNALVAARGYGAEETAAAFDQARELARGVENTPERFSVLHGLWAASYLRGEFARMRQLAHAFLRATEAQPNSAEAGVAQRLMGVTELYAGELAEARAHLERALALFDPQRDRDLVFSMGHDAGVGAMAHLGQTCWMLGEFDRARVLINEMTARASEVAHVGTTAFAEFHAAQFEILRHDPTRAEPHARSLASLARDHEMALWKVLGVFLEGWIAWRSGDRAAGLAELRGTVAQLAVQKIVAHATIVKLLLARAEAEAGELDAALATIDDAIEEAARSGQRRYEAEIHLARGEILLAKNSADPAPAESAFLAAIAVAQQQKARSFELRAALSLGTLYLSTGRLIDTHDVLAPAVEGFSPTPELPEIAVAQALLEALAETDEVKAASASREQRLRLQVSYGQAVMWSKGFAAEETKAAFARVGELSTRMGNAEAPLDAHYARSFHSLWRGEFETAQQAAESFLREAVREARPTEVAAAHRSLGLILLFQGDFARARAHCEQTLQIHDPERDREAKFRFGTDSAVSATTSLAIAAWCLGDVGRARELIDQAVARAVESAHAPTLAVTYYTMALLETLRDSAEAARCAAEALVALSREHGIAHWLALGALPLAWARAKLGDRQAGSAEFRQALAEYASRGAKFYLPFYHGLLAEIEAGDEDVDAALSGIDEALALAGETGEHWFDAETYRIRGEILVKQNPADPAPAEAAFLAAIAVAQQQKARSFELRAALSLAKLYQSTGRRMEAHDVLGPALEGFSPTPEFPEIAEATALLEALAADEAVKAGTGRRAASPPRTA